MPPRARRHLPFCLAAYAYQENIYLNLRDKPAGDNADAIGHEKLIYSALLITSDYLYKSEVI